jgi:uncharacterized protein YjcR
MAGRKTDWEALEVDYRAGIASIRELARKYDVSDTAIRKKAKADGWERDLTEKVHERVRSKLVRAEVRTLNAREPGRTEAEIIEAAAETAVQVVQIHRRDVRHGRLICAALFAELQDTSANREIIAESVDSETQDDSSPTRRNQMMKAISLPTRARAMLDLSAAMKNLVAVERQAFNLNDKQDKQDGKTIVFSMSRTRSTPDE